MRLRTFRLGKNFAVCTLKIGRTHERTSAPKSGWRACGYNFVSLRSPQKLRFFLSQLKRNSIRLRVRTTVQHSVSLCDWGPDPGKRQLDPSKFSKFLEIFQNFENPNFRKKFQNSEKSGFFEALAKIRKTEIFWKIGPDPKIWNFWKIGIFRRRSKFWKIGNFLSSR